MKYLLLFILFISSSYAAEKIVIIGDSLTEGYGVDKEYSYPSVLQELLKKNNHDYEVINGGVSGSTTSSGLSRLRWFLKAKPKIVMIALGANDGLRGIKLEKSKENLKKLIEKCQENKIKVILAGMHLPPNYGREYTKKFRSMYTDLKEEYKLAFIPFLVEGVAGKTELNLEDGIHPNEKGYLIVANNVYKYLKDHL